MQPLTPPQYSPAWLEHCRELAQNSDKRGTFYTGVIAAMEIVGSFRFLSNGDGTCTIHIYDVTRQGGDDNGPAAYHVTVAQACLVATQEVVRALQCDCMSGRFSLRGCKHLGAWLYAVDGEDIAGQETIPLLLPFAVAPTSGR